MLLSKHIIAALLQLLTQTPQLCLREVKPKPECGELSQLLNLSTHPQRYPLKINHTGKPPSQTLASYASTHAPHSAGSSLETSPLPFQEADVRMAAIRRDAPPGNVEAITPHGGRDAEERRGTSTAVEQGRLTRRSAKIKRV